MSAKNFISLVLFLSFTATQASAREVHFFGYHIPSPPVAGSSEYDQDFIKLHELQDHRTPEQCASAKAQSTLSLENGFGPETGVLTESEMKKAKVLSVRVLSKAAVIAYYFKKKFNRPRPFKTDTTLIPCVPKLRDPAYPSGHSTAGYALALALAKKFPYKKALILQQGFQIGENRLIGGAHHPTDVAAGRKLAEQVVRGMIITRTH